MIISFSEHAVATLRGKIELLISQLEMKSCCLTQLDVYLNKLLSVAHGDAVSIITACMDTDGALYRSCCSIPLVSVSLKLKSCHQMREDNHAPSQFALSLLPLEEPLLFCQVACLVMAKHWLQASPAPGRGTSMLARAAS